jgi:hypothetical protein
MSSNINPASIDGNYPVAGQDNDSQGFRDNFTNVKTNLTFAKNEITDLQDKVLLKSALSGQILNNDMQYSVMYRPQIKAGTESFVDHSSQIGQVSIDYSAGTVQKFRTNGDCSLVFSNIPGAGMAATMRIWMEIANTAHIVTLPTATWIGYAQIPEYGVACNCLTFTATGHYMFEFITVDGGSTFWMKKY